MSHGVNQWSESALLSLSAAAVMISSTSGPLVISADEDHVIGLKALENTTIMGV